MSSHHTPVEVVEAVFGGTGGVASVAGLHEKSTYVWRNPSSSRDAGDIPSTKIMRLLLAAAARRKIPLTADHLIFGANAVELAKLMPISEAA